MDIKGQVKKRHKDLIHGERLGVPCDVITLPHSGVLIADYYQKQVLLLRRVGDVAQILDQHVRSPHILCLDTDNHRLYVSGKDQHKACDIFVFKHKLLTDVKQLALRITKLNMKVSI